MSPTFKVLHLQRTFIELPPIQVFQVEIFSSPVQLPSMGRIPYPILQQWKSQIRTSPSPFIAALPKIELHIHLEGTLTPESRFMLAQRNSIPLTSTRLNKTFTTVEELQTAYLLFKPPANKGPGVSAFFEAYYGGMECLITEEDFYELAMGYFTKAHEMGVRYCEVMFDPQAHTRRGIPIPTFMSGIRRAQIDAEDKFNVPYLPFLFGENSETEEHADQSPIHPLHPPRPAHRIRNAALRGHSITLQAHNRRHRPRRH